MAPPPEEQAFFMLGARAAIAGGMTHISEQVKALEDAVVNNTGLAFDLSKTIIESTCKVIIIKRGQTPDKDDDLPKLFRTVSNLVPFLPTNAANDAEMRKSLQQTLNGMSTALQGVCELRNACGFASHGSAGPRTVMESAQAILAAQAADAIVGFLFRVHKQSLLYVKTTSLEYSSNPDFNDWIDEHSDPVKILNLDPYHPSDVLFSVDQEAYRDLLAEFKDVTEDDSAISDGNEVRE